MKFEFPQKFSTDTLLAYPASDRLNPVAQLENLLAPAGLIGQDFPVHLLVNLSVGKSGQSKVKASSVMRLEMKFLYNYIFRTLL